MKKVFLLLLIFFMNSSAQVCNTAATLSPARFSLGVAPLVYVNYGNNIGLLLNGGVGITRQIDVSLKLILGGSSVYFGGDVEFSILRGLPALSLTTGLHAQNNVGIDATLNLTFPVHQIVGIYCGLDGDVNFYRHEIDLPFWGFVGVDVKLRRSLALFFEIDIGLNYPAPHIFNLGLNVYF
ncbi:MAG: hypothetical protein N2053_07500 [Chitinispirillaceae bacterium]|nr:hypothetical protein [Chitinispirillaceae bacterium]